MITETKENLKSCHSISSCVVSVRLPNIELTGHLSITSELQVSLLLVIPSTDVPGSQVVSIWLVNSDCLQADIILLSKYVIDNVGSSDHSNTGGCHLPPQHL